MAYTHISHLDDPARPYARHYRCEATGVVAQIHTRRAQGLGFGVWAWRVTGAECDDAGRVVADEGALRVVAQPIVVTVQSDAEATPDVDAILERARLQMVAHVERAALIARQAAAG